MNLRRRLPVVMMLVVGLAPLSRADEKPKEEPAKGAAGHWTCVQNLPGGQTKSFELRLLQDGTALTGSVSAAEGETSVKGTADGAAFKLEIDSDSGTYVVKGKVDGDKVAGTWSLGTAEGTWEGTRQQPKPAN